MLDDGEDNGEAPHGPPASVGSKKKMKLKHREFRKRADDACFFFGSDSMCLVLGSREFPTYSSDICHTKVGLIWVEYKT
jgi:hypothetical protein